MFFKPLLVLLIYIPASLSTIETDPVTVVFDIRSHT